MARVPCTLSVIDPLLIAPEGKVVCMLGSVPVSKTTVLLLGTFYILNIEYPPGARNVYAFFRGSGPEQF